MAFEVIEGEDLRIVLTPKKQSAYGTRIVDADFTGGVSPRLNTATVGNVTPVRAGEGPKPMGGHEWSDGVNERIIVFDSALSLALDADSFMIAWVLALLYGNCSSSQELSTGHYTHTIQPINPLTQTTGTRHAVTTSVLLDTNGPDENRLKRILQDLAAAAATLSWSTAQMVALAIDLAGSGREVKTGFTVTIPALNAPKQFDAQGVKVEYGDKGGSLTDISDRIRSGSLRCNQLLNAAQGYYPGSGQYRGRMDYIQRTNSIDLAIAANRSNRDLLDDMLAMTQKEIKVTLDTGVKAGTSSTTNHQAIFRFPAVRISESPLNIEKGGSTWAVRCAENQIYKDPNVADSPVKITVDNTTAAYLAASS